MIGATVLNISSQDYEPQGSSVTILIADESKVPMGDTVLAPHGPRAAPAAHSKRHSALRAGLCM